MAFYDGKLVDGVSAADRTHQFDLPPPWDKPLRFLQSKEPEFLTDSKSYSNTGEGHLVLQLVKQLLDGAVPSTDIAVITPYDAQRQTLRKLLTSLFPRGFGKVS